MKRSHDEDEDAKDEERLAILRKPAPYWTEQDKHRSDWRLKICRLERGLLEDNLGRTRAVANKLDREDEERRTRAHLLPPEYVTMADEHSREMRQIREDSLRKGIAWLEQYSRDLSPTRELHDHDTAIDLEELPPYGYPDTWSLHHAVRGQEPREPIDTQGGHASTSEGSGLPPAQKHALLRAWKNYAK